MVTHPWSSARTARPSPLDLSQFVHLVRLEGHPISHLMHWYMARKASRPLHGIPGYQRSQCSVSQSKLSNVTLRHQVKLHKSVLYDDVIGPRCAIANDTL